MTPPRRVFRRLPLVIGGLLLAASHALAQANPKEIRSQIDAVATLLKAGKPDAAAASLAAAIEGLRAMQAQPTAAFKILADKAAAARAALEKAGLDVARLEIPGPAAGGGAAGRPGVGGPPQPAAGVSFTRQVAPLLVNSCGGCHVSGRRGNFQMASYEALIRSGMVQKGAGNASRLVEVILSGDMPRGGGRVSPDEVGMLMAWIDSGAICDADPAAGLDLLARGAAPALPAAAVMPATQPAPLKPGDVAFSTEIVPLLLEQCGNCHGERTAEANFRMTSLETIVNGGRRGPAVVPGKGGESMLVKKLRGVGIEGQRMPLNRPPLSDAQITVIEKWIDQGARIDLLSSRDGLEAVAAAGRAARLSAEQLTEVRFAGAEKLWDRMIPDDPPVAIRRRGLLLVGNLPKARIESLGAEAETLSGQVAKELGGDADRGLLKGGVVLYAFRNAFDYSALWQVILGSERPRGLTGHAGRSGDVVYGAILVPAADDSGDDTRLLVAEQLAAAALAGRGLPAWFVQGAGRAVAVKLVPKAPLAQAWKRETGPAVKQLGSPQDFLAGHADPAVVANAAGGFVTSLAGAGKLAQLVALVDGGGAFDDAFAKVFRSPPAQAFSAWAARAGGR